MGVDDASYRDLLKEKAEKLDDLRGRKPGQKGYKRSLKAFLEADAAVQSALLAQINDLTGGGSDDSEPDDETRR